MPPVLVHGRVPRRGAAERSFVPTRSDTIVAASREFVAARYLAVKNWAAKDVAQFAEAPPLYRPPGAVIGVILHETRGMLVKWSPDVRQNLVNRDGALAVHGYVDRDGTLYQHNDLVERVQHSRLYSAATLGFEIISPMLDNRVERQSRATRALYERIPTVWDHEGAGHYLVPPIEQLEGVVALVTWLTSPSSPLSIPRRWVKLIERDGRRLMAVRPAREDARLVVEGIAGHGQLQRDKSDGVFAALYCWLRLEAGLEAGAAFDEAKRLLQQRSIAQTLAVDLTRYAPTSSKPTIDFPQLPTAETAP